jgi:3-methylfumaryl-CoA hydratase
MTAHAEAISISPTVPAVTKQLFYSAELADRVAIMLDLPDRKWPVGDAILTGWHFALIGAETPRAALRDDGFPGLGIVMPRLPGRRLVAGGRKVAFHAPIRIGQALERTSRIVSMTTKAGGTTIISLAHNIRDQRAGTLLLEEAQTYLQLEGLYEAPLAGPVFDSPTLKAVTPDETMLFQFSALSFNTHKIHVDRDYARAVEGYPDLVVNGGLTTLLMTEIARELHGETIRSFTVKNAAPLFCNQPIRFAQVNRDGKQLILAMNPTGRIAAEMEIETDVL